jgi:hypothetical protein
LQKISAFKISNLFNENFTYFQKNFLPRNRPAYMEIRSGSSAERRKPKPELFRKRRAQKASRTKRFFSAKTEKFLWKKAEKSRRKKTSSATEKAKRYESAGT